MKDQARVWDRIAPRYIPRPVGNPAAYEHKLAVTQQFLRPDMRVLEFGCGSGNTARRHAPLVKRYDAIDISPAMIALGRDAGPVPDNLTLEVGNFDDIALTPESYDAVLAMSVLHLLPDPAATIRKVAAVLTPGGVFISSTGLLATMPILRVIAPIGQAIGKIPHMAFFDGDGLRGMLRDAGLVIEVDEVPGDKITLFLVARKPG